MFSNILDMVRGFAEEAGVALSKIKDKATFKRLVYASYLIARADGVFDSSEKTALSKLIQRDLPQFKLVDILDAIKEADDKVSFDETFGTMELLEEIGKATGDDAALIIRTACYIGAADGNFDDDEKAVARRICDSMRIDPKRYGL